MFADNLFGPIKQWGYLVKDLDQAMECWVNQLGVGPFWGFRGVTLQSHFRGQQTTVEMQVGLAYQNGVQIELIHQTNEVVSPYSDFYATDSAQFLHQAAYLCPDIDAAVARGKEAGLQVIGHMETLIGTRYYYMDSPSMTGLVVELMEQDDFYVAEFERCSKEAENWQGEDPFRLIEL